MKNIFKILLICIYCYMYQSSFAQDLKTYTGEYENPNAHSMYESGTAKYTYKEGEGKRIFHGNFSYTDKERSLKGYFVNDKQDGVWVLTEKTNFTANKKYYNGKRIISVTYHNGAPEGPFSILLIDSKSNITRAYVKAQFRNGKLDGSVTGNLNTRLFDFWGHNFNSSYDTPYLGKMTGTFTINGYPSGIWTVTNSACEITEQYNTDGVCIVTETNTSTGDQFKDQKPPYLPNMIVEAANYAMRATVMRNSERIQIPLFDLTNSYQEEEKRRNKDNIVKLIRNIFIP